MKLKHWFSAGALVLGSLTTLASCNADSGLHSKKPHQAIKTENAQPIIWIGDFNNFDDAVALMLIAKDPRYTLELAVVEDSFNTVAHGANTVYNILEWLGNNDTQVIRGAYFATEEVAYGANGKASVSPVNDDKAVLGREDYQLPNSSDFSTGTWNLERRNAMGINLYGQYVPGPWRDNGSTLYGTDHLIPRAKQEHYRYQGNNGVSFSFELAEDIILETMDNLEQRPVVFNTGKLTTLARVLGKANEEQLAKIDRVIMMGGGFENYEPFTENHEAACFGDKSRNLGGNIFSHPSFGCDSDFSTHQEFNILLDPLSAQWAFDALSKNRIETYLVPTNSTDMAKVQGSTIEALAERRATPEACYTSQLLSSIREFEGGDFQGNGDFAMDAVIRLWDIIAALVLLEPETLEMDLVPGFIEVDQLNAGLADSMTPYDPITFDPTVGKTTLAENGEGLPVNVVMGINHDAARTAMIERLRDRFNAARKGAKCRAKQR